MAIMILMVWYCDFKDSKVVIVLRPQLKGRRLTMEAVSDSSLLYKRIPKIISSAKKRKKPQLPQKSLRQFQLCLIALSNKKETRPL
jgi:hypothetical protein